MPIGLRAIVLGCCWLLWAACTSSSSGEDDAADGVVPTDDAADTDARTSDVATGDLPREPCADRDPDRRVYFGDLHIHTAYSFDAYVQGTRLGPSDAYAFARGASVMLPPLDSEERGTREARLGRPLDFAAVTDHAEFLGETRICSTPGLEGHESDTCDAFRVGGQLGVGATGTQLTRVQPSRDSTICGGDGARCATQSAAAWEDIQTAAEEAYDRSSDCAFTSFVAYEYSAATDISTMHRNVIFRGSEVPNPVSYLDTTDRWELWDRLRSGCTDAGTGCEVLAIPHNSNQSNGRAFVAEYPSDRDEADAARLRAATEPLVEIFQHKGDSECMNGLAGVLGRPDELCEFEKTRDEPIIDCGDDTGTGGLIGLGCASFRDYARGALLVGLSEWERIGVNPFRVGMIASTDNHAATPGAVTEDGWLGFDGTVDDEPAERMHTRGTFGGLRLNPGGLVAVWAEENSRPAIFDALRRREAYGTSGPRISVRFFGGAEMGASLCDDPNMVAIAYQTGVPMGGILPSAVASDPPTFLVSALSDPGTEARPGTPIQRIQIVKGWVDDGELRYSVFDVAGDADNGAAVDTTTCARTGPGFDSLCAVWTDPEFVPEQPAYYYARVVENPSCRWSAWLCASLDEPRPEACESGEARAAIQERAWSSPIWYEPAR